MPPGSFLFALFLLIAASPSLATERAQIAVPIVIEAPAAPERAWSFRVREMFGGQPARYRAAVALDEAVIVTDAPMVLPILAGEPLIEMRATSRDFSGPVYCKPQRAERGWPVLLCLADRDGDGALDQLWTGGAASISPLVPFPDIRSLRTIAPVRHHPIEPGQLPGFEIGFYVSGTNPLLGQHHFYPVMRAGDGPPGFIFFDQHEAAAMRGFPKSVTFEDSTVSVRRFADGVYEAVVTRPFSAGERMITSPYPRQTVIVSVPG